MQNFTLPIFFLNFILQLYSLLPIYKNCLSLLCVTYKLSCQKDCGARAMHILWVFSSLVRVCRWYVCKIIRMCHLMLLLLV